jgi:NO-binding membrane sensor protein with MHYT domain
MHFVGNRAIVMGDGDAQIQLYYNAGYTALSAVLPVIMLYIGLFLVDRFGTTLLRMYLWLVVTGLAAGLSITGMHYIGNLGTSNYTLSNNHRNIIGACAIAVITCWFSFTVIFHLRERWITVWYGRLGCATLLTTAVCGMHWTASVGTSYRLRSLETDIGNRNGNVIVASALVRYPFVFFLVTEHVGELTFKVPGDPSPLHRHLYILDPQKPAIGSSSPTSGARKFHHGRVRKGHGDR